MAQLTTGRPAGPGPGGPILPPGPSAAGESLEGWLGDPRDADREFSHSRCADLDAAEQFPDVICAQLQEWGVHRFYVPVTHGGRLRDFVEPFLLIRLLARRDLTVAIAHAKTFLGCVSSWVSADADLAGALARRVLAGSPVAWGLTERAHGSDLLAGELTARAVPGGYVLNGEKWLINNATRADLMTVLARTDAAGGARGFDVFVVDKRTLPPGTIEHLPKEHTHGIRGADISGFVLRDAPVDERARIGVPGSGLEVVLKSLQLTRTLCTSLSLGAGDHMLRRAVRHARHGGPLTGVVRRALCDGYADHLLAEAVSTVAVRSIQALTGELGVTSAIVKYLVPTRTDTVIGELARLPHERPLLAENLRGRGADKVIRDHLIVALFDGNTMVNLHALVNEFPGLVRGYRRTRPDDTALDTVFDLRAPLPAFDPARLSLISRHGSSVMANLPVAVAHLRRRAQQQPALTDVARMADVVLGHVHDLHDHLARHRPVPVRVPAAAFQLARRYALGYAAAACIGLWLGSGQADHGGTNGLWRDGAWLTAVLRRILTALGERVDEHDPSDAVLERVMIRQERDGRLLSLQSMTVAEGMVCG